MPGAFGQVIPVSGFNFGFAGKVSRLGERVIAARQVLSTTTNPIVFGQAVVINPTTDTYQSVADFITGGGTFTAALFAGIAISEVETTYNYPYNPYAGGAIGSYPPGQVCEVLERGSITIAIQAAAAGTPQSQGQLYIRKTANASYPSAVVGGFEVAADSTNTVAIPNLVFRTGAGLDANNIAEVTILSRAAA